MSFALTDPVSPMELRKDIADDYTRLTTLLNRTDHFVEGKSVTESVAIYRDLAKKCERNLYSTPHEAVLLYFQTFLGEVLRTSDPDSNLKTVVRRVAQELSELDPVWFYERHGDEWLVFRAFGDSIVEEMAYTETEGLAVKILDMLGAGPTPSAKLDEIPEGFRVEEGPNDDWDLYRTPEAIDDEDEPEEEWFARVNTEYMAQILCERMIGYHV